MKAIADGRSQTLQLGNVEIWRDGGWAADYVEAMRLMLQVSNIQDYVIASGRTHSLGQFVEAAFAMARIKPHEKLMISGEVIRPSDLRYSALDPSRIAEDLGWKAKGFPSL